LVYVLASCARKRKIVATRGKRRSRKGPFDVHATVTSAMESSIPSGVWVMMARDVV